MIRFTSILVFLIVIISSCRSTKKIQSAISKKDSTETVVLNDGRADSIRFIKETYDKLLKNRIDYKTFSAKINVDYQGANGKKYDVNAFVRMMKDSLIWISVNGAFGIEGMRVLIDKDSIRILNKLDKEYQVRSMDFLQDLASLPLDLRSMQELIIGNPVFLDSNIVSYTIRDNTISMLSYGQWFKHLIAINDNDHLVLSSKLDDADILRNRTAYLNYSDYENKKDVNFSTSRHISITEKTILDIKLNYKQYEFNETLTFPFNVPKNYTLK
jgi:uncharacterized protein DUF4292